MTDFASAVGSDLYIHVPFCARVCAYCAYPAEVLDSKLAERYVSALRSDADRFVPPALRPVSLAVGGGTPSALPEADLDRLFDLIARWASGGEKPTPREVSFEVNPEDITDALLHRLRAGGVTRVSVGVQSLADGELRALGRSHDAAGAERALRWCLEAGFRSVSADVLTGIAGQSRESLLETLDRIRELGVGHIEFFGLDPDEPGAEPEPPWTPRERRRLAAGWADENGFEHYELNALARPGHESLHRVRRAMGVPLHAIGAGAVARLDRRSIERVRDATGYVERVSRETSPILPPESTSVAIRALEHVMGGLHLRAGIELGPLPEAVLRGLRRARTEGWIEGDFPRRAAGRVRLTPTGWQEPDRALGVLVEAVAEGEESRGSM